MERVALQTNSAFELSTLSKDIFTKSVDINEFSSDEEELLENECKEEA